MIQGADADNGGMDDVGYIGGTRDITLGSTEDHTLTEAEMPAHTHTAHTTTAGNDISGGFTRVSDTASGATGSTGGDGAHDHDIATLDDGNFSPYYALAYIIKL
jgi:microcystin-dependent protein